MKKNAWYWIIGALAVILIAGLVWAGLRPDAGTGENGADDIHAAHQTAPGEPEGGGEDEELAAYLKEQDASMNTMMAAMMGIERAGNADVDFLLGMIPHHEAAVEMAESYLDHGGAHTVLAPLAEAIIAAQKAEIQQMSGMLATLQEAGAKDEAREDAYLEAYDAMMAKHHAAHAAAADNLDAAFAEGMLLHHQMAVDMAEAILAHGGDEAVKTLAQTIVDTQAQEIDEMQQVLDELENG